MATGNNARLLIMSRTENVSLARLMVAAFAAQMGFTLTEIEEIKMAVAEAVNNAILHGYKESEGVISLSMVSDGTCLQLEVKDNGCGMANEKREVDQENGDGGLGLLFIRNFMDDVEIISYPGEGTTVKMKIWTRKGGVPKAEASSDG